MWQTRALPWTQQEPHWQHSGGEEASIQQWKHGPELPQHGEDEGKAREPRAGGVGRQCASSASTRQNAYQEGFRTACPTPGRVRGAGRGLLDSARDGAVKMQWQTLVPFTGKAVGSSQSTGEQEPSSQASAVYPRPHHFRSAPAWLAEGPLGHPQNPPTPKFPEHSPGSCLLCHSIPPEHHRLWSLQPSTHVVSHCRQTSLCQACVCLLGSTVGFLCGRGRTVGH